MADLFISHSSLDTEWTRELRRQLEAAGYTCWMAPDDVNGPLPWAEQILTAIEACRVMIVVVSRAANGSNHVSKEVGVALEHDKPLLPIRTEDIIPTGSLNYLLQLVQWIDAFPGGIADHLDRIRRAVAYSIPSVPVTGSPPVAAGIVSGPAVQTDAPTQPTWQPPPPVAAPAPPPYTPPPAYQTPPPPPPTPVTRGPGAALVVGTRVIGASTLIAAVAVAAFAVLALATVGGVFSGRSSPTAQPSNGTASLPIATTAFQTASPAPTEPRATTPSPTTPTTPSATTSTTPTPTPTPTQSPTPNPAPTPSPTLPATSTPFTDLAFLLPSEVEGISLTTESFAADTVFGTDAGSNAMRAFLASVGKEPHDLLLAQAKDSSSTSDLEIYAFHLEGVDPILLQHAVITGGFLTSEADTTIVSLVLGGKSVVQVNSTSTRAPVYFFSAHGVVFAVETDDPHLADSAIAATPDL